MYAYLSQNGDSDGHFEMLNGFKYCLVQKFWPRMYLEAVCDFDNIPKNSNLQMSELISTISYRDSLYLVILQSFG